MLRTREELYGCPSYEVIWSGAIDRQLAAQAQRPAPSEPTRREPDVALTSTHRITFSAIRLALTDTPSTSGTVSQRLGLPRGSRTASLLANMAARGQSAATWGTNPHYGNKGQKEHCWLYSRREAA